MDDQFPQEESKTTGTLTPETQAKPVPPQGIAGPPAGAPPPLFSAPPPPPPPPFLSAPPPILVPPKPKRSSGSGWRWVALIALVVLAFSLLANLSYLARFLLHSESRSYERNKNLEEVFIERKSSPNKILVIDVEGIITSANLDGGTMGMVDFISEQLKTAAKDNDIKAVLLKVNSPGGEVLAADEINRAITKFQKETGRPVVASMGSLAASGGYYVSAPCRWIVANELTITGSIGVIMHGYNYRGLMDKVGVRPETYKSGKFKDMLSGDKEPDIDKLSPEDRDIRLEERKMVKSLIAETFDRFKMVVRTGRKESYTRNSPEGQQLAEDWESYADGRVFSGKQALNLGFVDELGNFEDAVRRTREIADVPDASLVAYREPFNLGSLLGLFGKSDIKSIKVDLGFNSTRLQAGHMYYITPMVLD